MKDISGYLHDILKEKQRQCPSFRNGICSRTSCPCERWASLWAYIHYFIPRDCHLLTLDDFNGLCNGKRVIAPEVVKHARRCISNYCWGEPLDAVDANSPQMLAASKIDQRRANGTSLIIHGEQLPPQSEIRNKFSLPAKIVPQKMGRTLLASIVFKEILKRRLFEGHSADNYGWVQYQTLKARVMAGNMDAIIEYQSNDWLVVDNIFMDTKGSENAKAYQQEKLDAVFMERISQGLPTILVFQFDIASRMAELQDIFGVGISQIALDHNTHTVSLTSPA